MIYLDYAAHTPVAQEVLDVFAEVNKAYIANPNASHGLGKAVKEKIDEETQKIANLLGVKESEIIYTSGATEANNLALKGIVGQYRRAGKHIVTSYLEHSSITSPLAALQKQGYEVDFVDILPNGQVDLVHLKSLLREDTVLVSIAYVDSEIGTIQPIEEIGKMVKEIPQCFFHVDATQAVGKFPLAISVIDLMTFAGHKFYGLNGCGILVKKETIFLEPIMHGGVSTTIFRSGTPTTALIASTRKAMEMALPKVAVHLDYVKAMNKQLRDKLETYAQVEINTPREASPYILNISLKGISSIKMQELLSEKDVYVATKSACCTLNTPSRPVYALTKDRKKAMATIRISLSHLTTQEEINLFLQHFDGCYQALLV